jgi:glutaredoxin-like protein NrdH
MKIPVTVYTNPNCVQCDMTKKQFDKLGVDYTVVDLTSVPDKVAEFKELGYLSAPIVTTDTKVWAGFKLAKIQSLASFIKSLERN